MQIVDKTLDYIKIYTGCDDKALKRIKPMLIDLVNSNKKFVVRQVMPRPKDKVLNIIDVSVPLAYHRQPLLEWVDLYCEKNDISIPQLRKRSRITDVVLRRNKFIINANMNNFKTVEIAKFLGMHHSTIVYTKYHYVLPKTK